MSLSNRLRGERQNQSGPTRDVRRGASEGRARWSDKLKSYVDHHRSVFVSTGRRLLAEPVQTLMTALVVAIALGLPAALYVGVVNLQQLGGRVESSAQMTVFLKKTANAADIDSLQKNLQKDPDIQSVSYISSQQALQEFQLLSGFGNVLEMLDDNPLPSVLLVQPDPRFRADLVGSEALVARIAGLATVDDVRLDMKWMRRLQGILEIGQRLVLSLGLALSLGVLLIIGNTIRLAIESRRDEIVVVKLVGGTDSYVRRPLLYTGLWYGLLGGLIAWLLVLLAMLWVAGPVAKLAVLYQTSFQLAGLGMTGLLGLLLSGALLGLIGAWLAVARHLASIEPK
ncbi:permease-like cell division protein FtsX [Porticoccus sp.]